MRAVSTWLLACCGALVALVALTACGGPSEIANPSDASGAVRAAYETYWVRVVAASASTHAAGLDTVATSPEIAETQLVLKGFADKKQQLRGSYGHSVDRTDVDGDNASLDDCMTVAVTVVDRSGAKVDALPPGPFPVHARLTRVGGKWLVADITERNGSCKVVPSGSAS